MGDALTEAREALAAYDTPRCGVPLGASADALGACFCPMCNACYTPSGVGACPACEWEPIGRCNLPLHHRTGCAIEMSGPDVEHLRAALAEVDRLTARVAEVEPFLDFHRGKVDGLNARITQLEQARAGDVAGIVGWLRTGAIPDPTDPGETLTSEPERRLLLLTANAIERGDWRDAPLPPDPRDARIAALEAEVAGLRAVTDTVTGVRDA